MNLRAALASRPAGTAVRGIAHEDSRTERLLRESMNELQQVAPSLQHVERVPDRCVLPIIAKLFGCAIV